jgi:branched-chain amino acid aminotransferase
MNPLAWMNGQFLPFCEASLPLHDAGFASGATVVDNARTYSRELFRWPEHLARFRHDCEVCEVPLAVSDQQLTAAAEQLVEANANGGELHVVTFATPGPLGFYLDEPNGPPTVGMVTYPLPVLRYRPFFESGAALVAMPHLASGAGVLVPPTVKHRSRIHWHVADRMARRITDLPHALAVSMDGESLLETSVANLLAVIDGAVITPPREWVLDGISLRVTRELCTSLGLAFREEPIPLASLTENSELLLTGTGFGLAGVSCLHGGPVPVELRWPGPVFTALLAAWSALTGTDIAQQFTA